MLQSINNIASLIVIWLIHSRNKLKLVMLFCVACSLILSACATSGPSVRRTATARGSIPVPVSAAQRNDFADALALMKKQKYEEAIPILEKILAENNRLPGTYINLAIAYMNLPREDEDKADDFKKAETALQSAVNANSREPTAHHQLGRLFRKTGRLEQAKKSYERAIDLDSNYAIAHYNLAVLCDIYLQQFECAIKHFEIYQRLVPEQAEKTSAWLTGIRRRAGIPEPAAVTAAAEEEAQ